MSKKVFAFDIDGTFINDDHIVQKSHIDAVIKAKEAGHVVALCSGRPHMDMIPVLEQMPENTFRYLVCNNGSYVVDTKTGEKFMDEEIPFDMINDFYSIAQMDKFSYAVHTLDFVNRGILWDENEQAPEWFDNDLENIQKKKKNFVSWEKNLELIKDVRICQLSILGTEEAIQKVLPEFEKLPYDVEIHIAGKVYLDVNPKGISKISGLQTLSEKVGVPIENFVVFGDSGNDLQMLREAGLGVAMANGTKEAKEAADIVIGDNNSSSLADKVLELI